MLDFNLHLFLLFLLARMQVVLMLTILLALALFFLYLKINILDFGILIITLNYKQMKTLFIIYVLLSVLVVLFSWIVNVELKKQLVNAQNSHKATMAELANKQNDLTDLLKSFNEHKLAVNKMLEEHQKTIADLSDIVEIFIYRYKYNELECFNEKLTVSKMLELVRDNDLSKKKRTKKSGDKN